MIDLQKALKHAVREQLDNDPNVVYQVDLPSVWKQIKSKVEPANKKILNRVS
jgi:hypothetical protein